jgi:hypothetical protein
VGSDGQDGEVSGGQGILRGNNDVGRWRHVAVAAGVPLASSFGVVEARAVLAALVKLTLALRIHPLARGTGGTTGGRGPRVARGKLAAERSVLGLQSRQGARSGGAPRGRGVGCKGGLLLVAGGLSSVGAVLIDETEAGQGRLVAAIADASLDVLRHGLVQGGVVIEGGLGDVRHKVGVEGREVSVDGLSGSLVDVLESCEFVSEGFPVPAVGAEAGPEQAGAKLGHGGGGRAGEASRKVRKSLAASRGPPLGNVGRGIGEGSGGLVNVAKELGSEMLLGRTKAARQGLAESLVVGVVFVLVALGHGEVSVLADGGGAEVLPEGLGVGDVDVDVLHGA